MSEATERRYVFGDMSPNEAFNLIFDFIQTMPEFRRFMADRQLILARRGLADQSKRMLDELAAGMVERIKPIHSST